MKNYFKALTVIFLVGWCSLMIYALSQISEEEIDQMCTIEEFNK